MTPDEARYLYDKIGELQLEARKHKSQLEDLIVISTPGIRNELYFDLDEVNHILKIYSRARFRLIEVAKDSPGFQATFL